MQALKDQIIEHLDALNDEQQLQLLDMAKALRGDVLPAGTPAAALLAHMQDFTFAPGAVDEMMRAIEEGCEGIDWDEWQ
jgi:hypothetical protein